MDDIIALFSNPLQRGDQRASLLTEQATFHLPPTSFAQDRNPTSSLDTLPSTSPLSQKMTTPPQQPPLPTPSSIRAASTLIAPYIHRTPLLTCATLNRLANTPLAHESQPPTFSLFFKTENLQKIGAFKARGAHHALLRLIERLGLDSVRDRGVVTHSSGNHAQALALAAATLGVKCTIVMPSISTASKIAGTRLYCSDLLFSGSTSVEREAVVRRVQERTRAILVPPYDDRESLRLLFQTDVLGRE